MANQSMPERAGSREVGSHSLLTLFGPLSGTLWTKQRTDPALSNWRSWFLQGWVDSVHSSEGDNSVG